MFVSTPPFSLMRQEWHTCSTARLGRESTFASCALRQACNGTAWNMEGSLIQGNPLAQPRRLPSQHRDKKLSPRSDCYQCDRLTVPLWRTYCTNVMYSVYQCDGRIFLVLLASIFLPMWCFLFLPLWRRESTIMTGKFSLYQNDFLPICRDANVPMCLVPTGVFFGIL